MAMLAIGEAILFRRVLVALSRRDQRLALRRPILVEHFRQFGNPRGVRRIGIGELDQIIVFTDVRGRSVLGGFVDSALRRRRGGRGRRYLLGLRRLVFGTHRQPQRPGQERTGRSEDRSVGKESSSTYRAPSSLHHHTTQTLENP